MDGWLMQFTNEEGTYDGRHYKYAWNRFLAMIKEQKLKTSDEEKQEVKNYIFQCAKLESATMFQKMADKCLMEAKKHFGVHNEKQE